MIPILLAIIGVIIMVFWVGFSFGEIDEKKYFWLGLVEIGGKIEKFVEKSKISKYFQKSWVLGKWRGVAE